MAGRPTGRPGGEAGNRTSYSPVGAGTGAELGNIKNIMNISRSFLEAHHLFGTKINFWTKIIFWIQKRFWTKQFLWCLWEQIFINWIFLGTKIYLDLYIISNSKFLFDSKKFWAPKIFFYYLFFTWISFTNYVWNEKAQTDGETKS